MSYKEIGIVVSLGIHLLFGILILNLGVKNEKRKDIFVVNLVKIQENLERNKFKEVRETKMRDKKENLERINIQEKQNLEKKEEIEEKLEDNPEVSKKEAFYNIPDSIEIVEKEAIYIVEKQTKLTSEIISKQKEGENEINKVDLNKNDDFFYYKIIKDKIIKKIVYPEIAKRRSIEGNVKIGFIVLRNGEVEEIKVIESSKCEVLDKNSIKIIKSASPFPKFPETLNYEKIFFVMDFNYKLKK